MLPMKSFAVEVQMVFGAQIWQGRVSVFGSLGIASLRTKEGRQPWPCFEPHRIATVVRHSAISDHQTRSPAPTPQLQFHH